MNGLVIIGHGSPREGANTALSEIARLVAAHLQGWTVSHAYLRHGRPDLREAVDACLAAGADTVLVHPYLLTAGGHVLEEIPELVNRLSAEHPDLLFTITPPLGVHEALVDVILERVGQALKESSP